MGYSQVSDIQKDFPAVVFSNDTRAKVKLDDIPDFILDADSLIDSYIGGRYATPVIAPSAVGVLRLYSRSIVADKIRGLLAIDSSTSQGANQNVRNGLSTQDVIKILQSIQSEDTDLVGAGLVVSKPISAAFASGSAPVTQFQRGVDQW